MRASIAFCYRGLRITLGDGVQKGQKLRSRFVVWAAGEFQYPKEASATI